MLDRISGYININMRINICQTFEIASRAAVAVVVAMRDVENCGSEAWLGRSPAWFGTTDHHTTCAAPVLKNRRKHGRIHRLGLHGREPLDR